VGEPCAARGKLFVICSFKCFEKLCIPQAKQKMITLLRTLRSYELSVYWSDEQYDIPLRCNNNNNNNKRAYASWLNSFTSLRALLVLHYLTQATSVAGQEGWQELSFYWLDGEYIPMSCPSVGWTGSIFPWVVRILVRRTVQHSREMSS
jgi:hypothetical protein